MPEATKWRVFVVDDEIARTREIEEFFEARREPEDTNHFLITSCNDFDDGLRRVQYDRFDLLVLDLRQGPDVDGKDEHAGLLFLDGLKKVKFIPVVFYTGLPHLVRNLESNLVKVVDKTDGAARVHAACEEIIATKVPELNRALTVHIDLVQAMYMWNFIVPQWLLLEGSLDRAELAHLIARRLAMYLSSEAIDSLAAGLGHIQDMPEEPHTVHPMRFYVMPVLDGSFLKTGDLARFADGIYRVLLTPTCDVIQKKADFLLWAECVPLKLCPEYTKWITAVPPANGKELTGLMRNRRAKQPERYFYLPGALSLPDLVVDLQKLKTTDGTAADEPAERVATLDSPYAEAIAAQFLRLYGRVGTPDLNPRIVLDRLRREAAPQQ